MANSTVSEDITNLFKTFGGDADHYQEMVSAIDNSDFSSTTINATINTTPAFPDSAITNPENVTLANAQSYAASAVDVPMMGAVPLSEQQKIEQQAIAQMETAPAFAIQSPLSEPLAETVQHPLRFSAVSSAVNLASQSRVMDSSWIKQSANNVRSDLFLPAREAPAWVSLWSGKVTPPNAPAADIPSVERRSVPVSAKKSVQAAQRAAWALAKPAEPLVRASSVSNTSLQKASAVAPVAQVTDATSECAAELPIQTVTPIPSSQLASAQSVEVAKTAASIEPTFTLPDMSQGKKAKRDQVFLEPKPMARKVKRFSTATMQASPTNNEQPNVQTSNDAARESSSRIEPTFSLNSTKTRSGLDK